jgi:hypothetical protein
MLAKDYEPSHIWNCDESGAQAGRNGGGRVLAKRGVRSVHSIIPKEREWLSVLVCVNAAGFHIPSFYIFRGKSFQLDYIKHCEDNASMAMQAKAWMMGHLFKSWIGHFVKNIRECGLEISPSCRHLLILDGHGSHVTMDVVKTGRAVGLDLLTLPSHTSHAMQPLDVSCFKPFKQAFRLLLDVWTLHNKSCGASKEVLATWISLALEKALTEKNITSGFRSTGIFSYNPRAMDDKMGPSEFYKQVPMTIVEPEAVDLGAPETFESFSGTFMPQPVPAQSGQGPVQSTAVGGAAEPTGMGGEAEGACGQSASPQAQAGWAAAGTSWAPTGQGRGVVKADTWADETEPEEEGEYEFDAEEDYLSHLEAALAEPEDQEHGLSRRHYVVLLVEGEEEQEHGWREEVGFTKDQASADCIDRFLVLPQEDVHVHPTLPTGGKPQVDYSRSYILTSDEFLASLEAKAAKKQQLLEEARLRKIAAEENREKRRLEKLEKERRVKEHAEERAAQKCEKQYWDNVKKSGWDDKLHEFIKVSAQNPSIPLRTPHNLVVPSVCRYNQRIAMLRAKFKKEGKDPRLVAPAMTVQPYMREPHWTRAGPSNFHHSSW